jgi:hypothetical protein
MAVSGTGRTVARRQERLRAADLEEGNRVGAAFGLGALEDALRDLDYPAYTGWGFLLGTCGGAIGLGTILGISARSFALSTKLIVAAAIAGAIAICWLMVGIGAMRARVGRRLFHYSGGLAQLARGEPEPLVLRWPDIETVTIALTTDEGTPDTTVSVCTLTGPTGTKLRADRRKMAEAVACAAHQALACHFVPPLIAAYESGEAVTAGKARVAHDGLTLTDGSHFPWGEIESVRMRHASMATATLTTRIDVTLLPQKRRSRYRRFDPSGIPNAIFFAHLIAHAAARHGVRVDGYEGPGAAASTRAEDG